MSFKELKKEFTPKGRYIIGVEDNGDGTKTVHSTDSPFWRDFLELKSVQDE